MTKEELQAAVDSMTFYHRIDLPRGITTPGIFPINLEFYKLPEDLSGKRVLDVGTYDGFFCFEALKRGASEVVAIDDYSDTIYPDEKRSTAQFDLCRKALGYTHDQCRHYHMSSYDVESLKPFDVILYLGCLYHARYPLLALDKLRAACNPNALLIVESHICDDYSPYHFAGDGKMVIGGGHGEKMVMEFYPGSQLAGCATNWWAPTLKCLANMVESAGFKEIRAWKIADPGEPSFCRGFVRAVAA